MQIHNLLVDRHSYTPKKANDFIEQHKEDKVYELLVLKKKLTEDEAQHPDVSYRRTMWRDFEEEED